MNRFATFLVFITVAAISAFGQNRPVQIFLAGDSTMAAKADDKRPETGWGEKLEAQFKPGTVKVENRAANGRSTKSFIDEGRWQKIIDELQKGDWVFIQFGHNDQKKDSPERYASPEDYKKNLIRFIGDVKAKGGHPLLVTPVVRRRFDKDGKFYDTHGEYPNVVRTVAANRKVPLIDLHKFSEQMVSRFGPDDSKKFFLHLRPGKSQNYPKGVEDDTHFSNYGAFIMATVVAGEIRAMRNSLSPYLKRTDR